MSAITSVRGRLRDDKSVYYQLSLCLQERHSMTLVMLSAPKWQLLYEESYRLRGSTVLGGTIHFPVGGAQMRATVSHELEYDEFLIT